MSSSRAAPARLPAWRARAAWMHWRCRRTACGCSVTRSAKTASTARVFRAANKTLLASLPRLVVLLVLPATQRLARTASLSFVSRSKPHVSSFAVVQLKSLPLDPAHRASFVRFEHFASEGALAPQWLGLKTQSATLGAMSADAAMQTAARRARRKICC